MYLLFTSSPFLFNAIPFQIKLVMLGDEIMVYEQGRPNIGFRSRQLDILAVHKALADHPYVTKFYGYCNADYLTEYAPLGSLHSYTQQLKTTVNITDEVVNFEVYKLLLNFLKTKASLQNEKYGRWVICDNNMVKKLLTQYLVRKNLDVVLHDLDTVEMLPPDGKGVKCNRFFTKETVVKMNEHDYYKKNLIIAPEQMDLYLERNDFKPFDEKVDIWRVPDVTKFILGSLRNETLRNILLSDLAYINSKCKELHPFDRPTADQILKAYTDVGVKRNLTNLSADNNYVSKLFSVQIASRVV